MQTTVNVVCYKSKTLSNGEHPLMIRLCQGRKLKYISLGISINAQHWDFKKNQPKRNCPNKDHILKLISDKEEIYREQVIEFKSTNKEFTVTTLSDKINAPVSAKTVDQLFDVQIERLISVNRLKYALTFKDLKNSLIKFNKHLDIYFSDIDVPWLKKYENWQRSFDLRENTIGIRFRTLRTLYNRAISNNIVKADHYPFKQFKVSKLRESTLKRSITKADIEEIVNFKTNDSYIKLSIDLFYFSYLSGGINFVDIAYLTRDNIVDNRLVYTRKKTKKLIKLPIQDKALDIIDKYSSDNIYLFPILSSFHKTDQQKVNRVQKVIGNVNRYLKAIGEELNIPIDLTTYYARHTYATVLKRSGVNTSVISESLGHSSEKVTQIYLDSFENSQIDEAMKNLL